MFVLPTLRQDGPLRPEHKRRLVLGLMVVLGGFGAAAFAVAPLALDTTPPLQTLVVEDVRADAPADLAAWREQSLALHRDELTRVSDSVVSVLRRLGVRDPQVLAALAADEALASAMRGDRRLVQASLNDSGDLQWLQVSFPAAADLSSSAPSSALSPARYNRLRVESQQGHWMSQLQTLPLSIETRVAAVQVRSQWQAAVADAGLPPVIAVQLLALCAERPAADCSLAPGASVAVLYETLRADGVAVPWNDGAGRVLAARFAERGTVHQSAWFVGLDGRGGYFDSRGRGRDSGFLASPVEFKQITSGFATRIDPFKGREQAHQGIDYSAPVGTPVHGVAAGVVEFAGRQSGYGNVVELRHSSDRSTLYAHLSRIDVAAGERVERGQVLGTVGSTGWATGPHLHFEYRVAGVHQDPQLASAATAGAPLLVDPKARTRFDATWRAVGAELDLAMSLTTARSSFE